MACQKRSGLRNWFGRSFGLWRPFGIETTVHWSFWLVVLWAGGEGIRWTGGWHGGLFAIGATFLFFGCVYLHELGHAVVARWLGVEVQGITLLPVGGLARIRNMPESGSQEFLIAAAGPLANMLFALGLGLVFLALWGPGLMIGFSRSSQTVLAGIVTAVFQRGDFSAVVAFLIISNLLLALFNLFPAFPMDGGRLLRATLASMVSYPTATRVASLVGQGIAVLTIVFTTTPYFGFQSLGAVFIAVFVFVGATYEDRLVQNRARLERRQVAEVMTSAGILTISPGDRLGAVMQAALNAPQFDLPVLWQGRLVGMLRRDDMLQTIRGGQSARMVSEVMRIDHPILSPNDTLRQAQSQMVDSHFTTLPVIRDGTLVGLLNIRDLRMTHSPANLLPDAAD